MALSLTQWVTILYVSLNVSISLFVSVLGVIFVREEIKRRNTTVAIEPAPPAYEETAEANKVEETELPDPTPIPKSAVANEDQESPFPWSYKPEEADDGTADQEAIVVDDTTDAKALEDHIRQWSTMGFISLWANLVWKMRSCYLSLLVHLFDVLTDILVIIEWWRLEKREGDIEHIDSRAMAWCGIGVFILHKVVSTFAFWMKDNNLYRSILQFFDILIFEEIHTSHKKIVSQFKGHYDWMKPIESTTSFKYIRSLEAVFESIPQSVLQMVFLIRTGGDYGTDKLLLAISILSIFQSIVSMTNSILKQDNLYMDFPKFKKHRQRLPPTFQFFKASLLLFHVLHVVHALCRFSEVFYRIALLSLFWAICGGLMFSVLLIVELLFILLFTLWERFDTSSTTRHLRDLNIDDMFLRFQCLVILPTEMIYALQGFTDVVNCGFNAKMRCVRPSAFALGTCLTLLCCYGPAALVTTLCCLYGREDHYMHPRIRIGVSIMEWLIMIVVGLVVDHERDHGSMFYGDYGFGIFVVGLTLFGVFTQYLYLMPRFAMPHNVSIRSKWGYAFNGEFDELRRMNDENWDECLKDKYSYDKTKKQNGTSPAMYALANGHYDIVEWLEQKGAVKHKELLVIGNRYLSKKGKKVLKMNEHFARIYIGLDLYREE